MKKLAVMIGVVALAVAAASCGGGGKYSDIKASMNQQAGAMDNFAAEIEKAENSGQVVAALDKFQKEMAEFTRQLPELQKKYPELKNQTQPPEELKDATDKAQAAAQKFVGAMMKVAQKYGQDPQVKEKLQQMQSAMPRMEQ